MAAPSACRRPGQGVERGVGHQEGGRGKSEPFERLLDPPAEPERVGHDAEAAAGERAERDDRGGGERVRGRQGDHAGRLRDPMRLQPRVIHRQACERNVRAAREHGPHGLLGGLALEVDLARQRVPEPRERGRHEPGGEGRNGGDADRRGCVVSDRGGMGAHLLERDERALRFLVEAHALGGRRDPGPAAAQQAEAERGLEVLDEPCDGGLGAARQPGGTGDAAGRHDRREGFQLPDLDLAYIHEPEC